ncbi:hypothetical protein P280DRAFT_424720, partial [Massarina eburnea CBS 473.64]
MGILLSTVRGTVNLLLPFTDPQTPLLQDLLHTVVLCGTLYYAPKVAEHYNAQGEDTIPHNEDVHQPNNAREDVPIDDNLVLEPDNDDGEEVDALPHAPTPPQGQARAARPAPPNHAHPGPAGPANPRPVQNRVIGTKKAKSIARRDQRRAYHEFQRSQAEQRRAAEDHGREEREAQLATVKARRAEEERKIAERLRLEREKKKEEERREAEQERERRERVVARVRDEVGRKGAVDLGKVAREEGKERASIERLVRASGMVAAMEKDNAKSKIMITGEGWMVRVDAKLMKSAYADAVAFGDARDGRVSFQEFGGILEKAVLARAQA